MVDEASTQVAAAPRRFGALRDRHSRPYLFTAGLSMIGDNSEHVITYWVLWQEFHSPALVGFEIISHWLPYLLLSVPFGALAERFDCRRLVQISQGLFMAVSAAWGVLFLTHSLQLWEACVLLVLHGCAGALWSPAEQMLLHDFAAPAELPGAVRMNATFKGLGALLGPVVGSALLFGLGPSTGIFVNVLLYVPMTVLMTRTPFTGHTRTAGGSVRRAGFIASAGALRTVAGDRVLVSMLILSGLIALCLGGSLQVAMPSIAQDLPGGGSGLGYAVLLVANGIGGVVGGILLEASGAFRPSTRVAVGCTVLFGATTLTVALVPVYPLAVAALVIGGTAMLASQSIGQAIVQVRAPSEMRGRVVGLYNMLSQGLRVSNGVTLALIGSAIGVPDAVAVGAGALVLGALIVLGLLASAAHRDRTAPSAEDCAITTDVPARIAEPGDAPGRRDVRET